MSFQQLQDQLHEALLKRVAANLKKIEEQTAFDYDHAAMKAHNLLVAAEHWKRSGVTLDDLPTGIGFERPSPE